MKRGETLVAVFISVLYLWMGYRGLTDAAGCLALFDVREVPPAMRNEVAAIYGGFGVSFGLLLLVAIFRQSEMSRGIILSLAVLTLGLAAGRIFSFCSSFPENYYPLIFMVLEILMGGFLLWVSRRRKPI